MREGPNKHNHQMTVEDVLQEKNDVYVARMIVSEYIKKFTDKDIPALELTHEHIYEALRCLVLEENVLQIKHLLSKLPFLKFDFNESCSALELAAKKGRFDLFQPLWDFFDTRTEAPMPSSMIDYAAEGLNPEIIGLVMARQARINNYEKDRGFHKEPLMTECTEMKDVSDDLVERILNHPEHKPILLSYSVSSEESLETSTESSQENRKKPTILSFELPTQRDLSIDRHQRYVQMMEEQYTDSSGDSPYIGRKLG